MELTEVFDKAWINVSFGLRDECQTMNCPWGILWFGLFSYGRKGQDGKQGHGRGNWEPKEPTWDKDVRKGFTMGRQVDLEGGIHFWTSGVRGSRDPSAHSVALKYHFPLQGTKILAEMVHSKSRIHRKRMDSKKLSETIRVTSKGQRNSLKKLLLAKDGTIWVSIRGTVMYSNASNNLNSMIA